MSFLEYLKTAKGTDGPMTDFIEDATHDKKFPVLQDWDHLERYLMLRGACPEALDAALVLWRRYRAAERKRRTVS